MIKILWFKLKQKLNQYKCEYSNYKLQTTQDDKKELFGKYLVISHKKSMEALQNVLEKTILKSYPLLFTLSGKEKIVKNGKEPLTRTTNFKKKVLKTCREQDCQSFVSTLCTKLCKKHFFLKEKAKRLEKLDNPQ